MNSIKSFAPAEPATENFYRQPSQSSQKGALVLKNKLNANASNSTNQLKAIAEIQRISLTRLQDIIAIRQILLSK
jgi:hypothetical protein